MKENGIFGILITLWASIFLQAWKSKMRYLSQQWDLESIKDELKIDERKGQFEFNFEIEKTSVKKLKRDIKNYGRISMIVY